ncbi:RagB/SusD family nutrient uptake outer membrane protein [Siphonobacter sp. BAB-5385]|uniref:RagB/SusD family nutrient uptake outer membrane protein n=1 Tax=Siphonobacter sp. BAB-5385 TaxID=1864822 RepID=UPI000B9EA75B|nr:RagB/SusD family nutrient uptake outer membrane protein [Siphonobacter sp. BAB-5385]OZI05761.1 RagB/SusD family nutrient uptake outer membrane protein [Siphonobacter sp. BAB-5385]
MKATFLILVSILFLTSCQSFLDVKPKESISDAVTITDKTSAETAVRGVYSALASGNYYGTNFQAIGYLSGDNVEWTGSQSIVQEFINHKVNADNGMISGVWIAIYQTINRANNVLAKVNDVADPALTTALKNQYLGEAYFVRALAYFDLARVWGGVPLITKPTVTPADNRGIARSSTAETYAQVLKDLDAAESLLPATTDRYRATQKTVWALKARYYLYQKDWVKAEEYASKLIGDATNYSLIKPYRTFFADNARGTQESIFEIFYNGTTEINAHRGQWQPQTNGGTRQWAPNTALVTLLNDASVGGNRSVLVAKDNQNRWYGNLYYRNPGSDPSYVLRIAEQYLIRSEARTQQNKLTAALSDLNAVRDRAGLPAVTAATSEAVLLAIENERRVEFALEPHRWFDLVRTGRAATVLGVTDPKRYVLPLPVDQLLVDKALVQNEGY